MPAPTRAQLISRLQKACHLPWVVLNDATDRYEAFLDNILEGAPTTLSAVANGAAETFLRRVAGLIGEGSKIVGPELQAMAEELTGFAATSPAAALSALYAYFVEDKPIRVRSRGITFGTPTAEAGNSFDGVLQRQTVDEEGFGLEAVTLERKVWECVADARTGDGGDSQGRPHEEFWVVRGENPNRYGIEETGSGANSRPRTKSALQDNTLFNQVFASATFSGSAPAAGVPAAPTAISGWTAETIGKITLSVDSLPRTYKDSPTVYKAVFGTSGGTADNYLTQPATSWQKVTSDSRCYHAEVWVRRLSSADGTLTLTLGSKSTTQDISSLSNNDWVRVRLSDGTDNKGWPRAWNSTTAAFTVDFSGNTTGTIEVCYPMLTSLDLVNGSLWAMTPGEAEAKVGDKISVTDALSGSDSIINQMLVRFFRRYLPHCGNTTSFISGAQTVTFAASGRTITRSAGSWVTDGWQAGMGAAIQSPLNSTGDTPKLVASVSALVLTLDTDETLVDEGPLSAGEIVSGGPYIEDP